MFDFSNLIPKFQDILGLQIPKVGIHLKMAGFIFLHPSTLLLMYVVVCLKSPHTLPTHFPYHVLNLVVSPMLRCTMKNRVTCNWPCNWVFLNCNDHLQVHCNLMYFYEMSVIIRVARVTIDTIHRMWNHICMQLMQLDCNYAKITIVQL